MPRPKRRPLKLCRLIRTPLAVHLRIILVPALLLACRGAHATDSPGLAVGLGQMLLGLGVVVALLLAALWLLKRLAGARRGAGPLKILGATAVGPRERVVVVEVAGKVLVLGVAPGRVTALHSLDAADLPGPPPGRGAGEGHAFMQSRLRRFAESRK